jgi:hypothetical protein
MFDMSLFLFSINLFNPTSLGFTEALIVAFLLGLVHGITPDEHTWPITFAYAVGSYSTKKGMKAGFVFSSGFTIQRSIISELAYFAMISIFTTSIAFGLTYIAVGIAMAVAGIYIARSGNYLHWHWLEKKLGVLFRIHKKGSKQQELEFEHKLNPIASTDAAPELREVSFRLAFIHGIIAGFGFGAFALILYTVVVSAMPSPWLGWVPGFLFGIGTMVMQIMFGAVFGTWLTKNKKLPKEGVAFVAKYISKNVLYYGGLAFVVGGIMILAFPNILSFGIHTGIQIHNLDNLDIGFFLVIIVVAVIGIVSYIRGIRLALKKYAPVAAQKAG